MTRWTEAALDAFRTQGDDLADEVVARLAANIAQSSSARTLLETCVANDQVPDSELPMEVRAYFEKTELKLDELLESSRGAPLVGARVGVVSWPGGPEAAPCLIE